MKLRLVAHGVVDSTNERAFAALASGEARHGDVHTATGQSAGRGRRGATWHSAEGAGLYMSVVLLPPPPALHPAALTMAAGLAVYRAARELGLAHVVLEWPNDVVARDAKLAGILVETRGLDARRPHYVVGIGVNVRQLAFASELVAERAVTSFAAEGVNASVAEVRDSVLLALVLQLERVREPATGLTHDFLDAARLRDAEVSVDGPAGVALGRLCSLSLARGLELETAHGARVLFALEHVRGVRARVAPSGSERPRGSRPP